MILGTFAREKEVDELVVVDGGGGVRRHTRMEWSSLAEIRRGPEARREVR